MSKMNSSVEYPEKNELFNAQNILEKNYAKHDTSL